MILPPYPEFIAVGEMIIPDVDHEQCLAEIQMRGMDENFYVCSHGIVYRGVEVESVQVSIVFVSTKNEPMNEYGRYGLYMLIYRIKAQFATNDVRFLPTVSMELRQLITKEFSVL